MEFLQQVLPIMIYFLLIIMLVIGIILGIKLIRTMAKVEKVVDDVNEKVQSLNGLFHVIDFTTDKLASITDAIVEKLSGLISKIFLGKPRKNKKKKEDD